MARPAAPRTSLACLCCSVALIAVGGATSPLVERAGAGAGSSAGDTRQQQKNSSYDFAHFESAVLPAFLGSFKIGPEVGSYGGTPGAIAGTPTCKNRFRADSSPLSSCRSPQAALKFSCRGDRVTRD